jgi:hypothetical protein
MPSIKERMTAFQEASSHEAFEKQRKRTVTPPPKKRGKTPPPAFLKNSGNKPKKLSKGRVVENKVSPMRTRPKDWGYLYELATKFDQFKLQDAEEKKTVKNNLSISSMATKDYAEDKGDKNIDEKLKEDVKARLEKVMGGNYTAKCDWLNEEWISERLIENPNYDSLTFRFRDPKVFKRFDKTDEANRDNVIQTFVGRLISHSRSKSITRLDLSNCLLPDKFLEVLSREILRNPKECLPMIQVLNLETNVLQGPGIEALSKLIEDENACRYLQVLMLENQKKNLTSDAESALASAIRNNPSIVVCSLRLRGTMEKKEIDDAVAYNIDHLRQARRRFRKLKDRKRNEIEQYFDNIAVNSKRITEVDLVGDQKFLALKSSEKTKSANAFGTNKLIKIIKMVKLGLDDNFAEALGESLAKNKTIEKIIIDSNAITGKGIKALFAGLGQNSTIVEFQVRHQSKSMAVSDEHALPGLIESNRTIIKLGVDARDQLVKMKLDKIMSANREFQRKLRVAAKKAAESK